MDMKYICLLVCFVCLVYPSQGSNSYVVLCPNVVRPGVPFTVNVHILRSDGPVTVTAAIKKDGVQIVSNLITVQQGQPYDVDLTLPSSTEVGSLMLDVSGSGGLEFNNQTSLNLEVKSMSILIQTDKAIYKPGQTVKFRALGMYPYLQVYTGSFDVKIKDPNDNIMEQWKGLSNPDYGVIKGEMVTATQPVLGEWSIHVTSTETGLSEEKTIVIDKYVLPKFEVKLNLPSFIEKSDSKLTGIVNAMYTYGKPVKGSAVVTASLPSAYGEVINQVLQVNVELDGESDFEFSMRDVKNLYRYANDFPDVMKLGITAVVTESLTGKQENVTQEIQYFAYPVQLEFLDITPSVFKPGLLYTAYLMVTLGDGQPLRQTDRHLVTVEIIYDWRTDPIVNTMTVPASGIVEIPIRVPSNYESVAIEANYYEKSVYRGPQVVASRAKSPSDNYVQITTTSTDLSAGDRASFTVTATEPVTNYFYQILSRGNIVAENVVQGAAARSHTFVLEVSHAMAPTASIVVYYVRNNGEVVVDCLSINVKNPFENEVTVAFSKDEAEPGEDISVDVTANPDSYVGILAVDQSVLLLKSGNDITQDEVFEELRGYGTSGDSSYPVPFGGVGRDMMIDRKKRSRSQRSIAWWWAIDGIDAGTIFRNAGLCVITDALVYEDYLSRYPGRHHDYLNEDQEMALGPVPAFDENTMADRLPENEKSGTELKSVERVRKYFPETWLWNDNVTGTNGQVSFASKVPDTITSWVVSSFSVSKTTGFGVVPSTSTFNAFKPFFVTLNLPYSVIRGEEIALQAIVFNYMDVDMDVVVTLEESNDFENMVISSTGTSYTHGVQQATLPVPAGEGRSVAFPLKPTKIGNVILKVKAQSTMAADAVERLLIVEAEGIPQEYTRSVLIDLSDSSQIQEKFEIILPAESLITDSVKAKISLVGDIMGNAMNNLDQLLRMPSGCGEQTMIGFAPDVFICDYLVTTRQDNAQIMKKALDFMKAGYQRELTYRHRDGSFSAFGESDESGSMWLTSFVVKSFIQAMDFIVIDPNIIVSAIQFIVQHQMKDGSFQETGRVVDTFIQGGIKGQMAMTAYTLIALSQSNIQVTQAMSETQKSNLNNAKSKGRIYLERGFSELNDPYSVAIVTLALHLTQSTYRDQAFEKLNSFASSSDGLMYWTDANVSSSDGERKSLYFKPKSAEIEITGYALLTYNIRRDKDGAAVITRWLTKQSNSFGGYSSTQDTVIALEALSGFGILAVVDGQDFTATITTTEMPSYQHQLQVDHVNRMILQQVELPVTSGHVMVDLAGVGSGILQFTVSFNTGDVLEDNAFNLVVVINDVSNNRMSIAACTKYLLGENTGMAVMEVGIPSGFYADENSLNDLHGVTDTLKRTEVENDKAVLYFSQIGSSDMCITFQALRSAPVAKAQPATVAVYDYYKPELRQTQTYTSAKQANMDICEVCEDCQGCDHVKPSSNEPKLSGKVTFTVLISLASILFVVMDFF